MSLCKGTFHAVGHIRRQHAPHGGRLKAVDQHEQVSGNPSALGVGLGDFGCRGASQPVSGRLKSFAATIDKEDVQISNSPNDGY